MQETLVWFRGQKICWRRDRLPTPVFLGFPGGSADKESACNVGDLGSIPGLGRSTGEGKGYLLQYSGLENSMNCTVHGIAKSQTQLSTFHFHFHHLFPPTQPNPSSLSSGSYPLSPTQLLPSCTPFQSKRSSLLAWKHVFTSPIFKIMLSKQNQNLLQAHVPNKPQHQNCLSLLSSFLKSNFSTNNFSQALVLTILLISRSPMTYFLGQSPCLFVGFFCCHLIELQSSMW